MMRRMVVLLVPIGFLVGCGRDQVDPMVLKAQNFLKTCDYASRISSDYKNLVADSLKITFLHQNNLQLVDRSNGFEWSAAFDVQYAIRNDAGAVLKKREAAQVNVVRHYMVLNLRDSGDFKCTGIKIDNVSTEQS